VSRFHRRSRRRVEEYVLIVDDEQSLRQVLELFFKKEGFESIRVLPCRGGKRKSRRTPTTSSSQTCGWPADDG